MKYSLKDKERFLILQCRYYKGESDESLSSEDIPSEFHLFRDYEKSWVEWSLNDDPNIKFFEEQISAYNLVSKDGDCTPLTLKALLWNRYLHWGGYGSIEEELKSFENWYEHKYLKWKTNREHRADKRWPGLVNQCLYFNDEKENPWTYCYSQVLVWRRKIWELEKEWCKALSQSYNCKENSEALIKELGLSEAIKKLNNKKAPLSLLNFLLTKEREERFVNNERYWIGDAIKAIEQYILYAPLGRDHRMYFAYYLGEDKCPSYYDEEYQRMGWSQERQQSGSEIAHSLCDFDSKNFQDDNRGLEGIWGWYADPKFPKAQREILYFAISNWGMWAPYCDEDKLAEEYLNYHYPGDDNPEYRKRRLILQCRYYNGEDEPLNDEDLPSEYLTFWNFERCWVNINLRGGECLESLNLEIEGYHLKSEEGDTTPITLKAVMCNRYMHWADPYRSFEERVAGFETWYRESYLQRKQNIESREE